MNRRLQALWIVIREDAARSGVLAVTVLVFGVVCVRQFVAPAIRSSSASTQSVQAGATSAVSSAQKTMDSAMAVLSPSDGPAVRVLEPSGMTRDPFLYSEEQFPRPVQVEEAGEVAPVEVTEAVGSDDAQVDPSAEDARRAAEAFARLELRSVVLGRVNAAVIAESGRRGEGPRLVAGGERISGFLVVSVLSDRVVLERGGQEFTLVRRTAEP
ncbi:MAG: hypothetical protein AAGD00_10070 [Planctomycetota bacterium]